MHNAQTLTPSNRSLLAALIVVVMMITITIKVGGSTAGNPTADGIEITITDDAGTSTVPIAKPATTATPSSATTAAPSSSTTAPSSSTTTTPRSATSGH